MNSVIAGLFLPDDYFNVIGSAYWQWAAQLVSQNHIDPLGDDKSIVDVTSTVTGYPEISYFIEKYFMPNVNAENQQAFEGVNLYENSRKQSGNYQYLFNL